MVGAAQRWYEVLRPVAIDAGGAVGCRYEPEVVLFYVARWCQKDERTRVPCLDAADPSRYRDVATRIATNLDADGSLVERLVAAEDTAEWDEVLRVLHASASRRVGGGAADDYAREARQRIAVVLLTGTPPSLAAQRLGDEVDGPSNEYVFQSPFWPWARRIVINHLIDDRRMRDPAAPRPPKAPVDARRLEQAAAALPDLVQALRFLPPKQQAAVVVTLTRRDLEDELLEHLHALAPDLFPRDALGVGSSDDELAARLGTTARRLAANRSAARCKLAPQDPRWELLLDQLMPHASTVESRATRVTEQEAG